MVYRNKTYVCFDADTDMRYYRLMTAWKENGNIAFNFHNAHDLNNLKDGSSEETIKDKLRERLNNSKVFIVLVGKSTKFLYKFVKWEIEYAIEKDIPIIVINLNHSRELDDDLCPPILKDKLALHIPFEQKIIDYALNDWPEKHPLLREMNISEAFLYKEEVYEELENQDLKYTL